jgi:hypothetical protein
VTGYSCKLCGAPAAVSPDGEITRACAHAGTVVASMAATAYGQGGMGEAGNPVLRFLRALGTALMRRAR